MEKLPSSAQKRGRKREREDPSDRREGPFDNHADLLLSTILEREDPRYKRLLRRMGDLLEKSIGKSKPSPTPDVFVFFKTPEEALIRDIPSPMIDFLDGTKCKSVSKHILSFMEPLGPNADDNYDLSFRTCRRELDTPTQEIDLPRGDVLITTEAHREMVFLPILNRSRMKLMSGPQTTKKYLITDEAFYDLFMNFISSPLEDSIFDHTELLHRIRQYSFFKGRSCQIIMEALDALSHSDRKMPWAPSRWPRGIAYKPDLSFEENLSALADFQTACVSEMGFCSLKEVSALPEKDFSVAENFAFYQKVLAWFDSAHKATRSDKGSDRGVLTRQLSSVCTVEQLARHKRIREHWSQLKTERMAFIRGAVKYWAFVGYNNLSLRQLLVPGQTDQNTARVGEAAAESRTRVMRYPTAVPLGDRPHKVAALEDKLKRFIFYSHVHTLAGTDCPENRLYYMSTYEPLFPLTLQDPRRSFGTPPKRVMLSFYQLCAIAAGRSVFVVSAMLSLEEISRAAEELLASIETPTGTSQLIYLLKTEVVNRINEIMGSHILNFSLKVNSEEEIHKVFKLECFLRFAALARRLHSSQNFQPGVLRCDLTGVSVENPRNLSLIAVLNESDPRYESLIGSFERRTRKNAL